MEKYDPALLAILQNEGKVAPFLDAILGFLYRRTDFFRIMRSETEKLGFPPGVARKLMMNIFSKYETQVERDAAKLEEMKRMKEVKTEENKVTDATSQQEALNDSSTSNSHVKDNIPPSESAHSSTDNPLTTPQNTFHDERGVEETLVPDDKEVDNMETDSQATENTEEPNEISKGNDDSDDKEDPEQARQRRLLQANPSTYNGAEMSNYSWSQIISEADLRVKIPAFILKGKQVRVDISKKHIHVSHQEEDGSWCKDMDNTLMWEINSEESMWTLSPGESVHINLEKKEERWWECVFVDEPKINTRKIDCSRPMTDLDDEAQAKIEEMMYNQRQKQLGLPQSHEQKTHDMLRKAWDAEGSPFKGQPFDPSKFNTDANGVINMNQS